MRCCVRIRKLWRKLPGLPPLPSWIQRFALRFTINMLIGLTILWLLGFAMPDSRIIHEAEDLGIDWMMKMYADTSPTKVSPHFVLLDINEDTYQKWQEPFVTPRDNLLKLLNFAVEGQPKIIIVDIELSYTLNHPSKILTPDDQKLYDFFARYDANCSKKECPHILLTRTFRHKPSASKDDYYEQRPSFLDNAVANSQYIHWASTLFDVERDNVLRRWRLWEPTCTAKQPEIVPSMQLLTVALLKNSTSGHLQVIQELEKIKSSLNCENPNKHVLLLTSNETKYLSLNNDSKIHLSPTRYHRRIIYTMSWKGVTRPTTLQGEHLILSTLSAHPIAAEKPMSKEQLLGSITVIGGSYASSRDIHATPLGHMPGTMVLINAIQSLWQYGELSTPSFEDMLLFLALFIFPMSLFFTLFKNSPLSYQILNLLVIIAVIPVSFWLFQQGVWLSFAIVLLIVNWHQVIAEDCGIDLDKE